MARSATLDMIQGSLGRQIIGFSLPLMFTNLLQMLFSMVDLAVVGRFSSSAAMGSVGSTTTLIFLFTGFLMGLGSGVNVLVATHFGARSEKNVRESVHTSFLVCLIAGFLMLALGLIFARPLLELLNTRDDLIDGAELYLRIYFLGMPAAALYNYGNGVLNAIGDTKTPLIFLSTAGVLNVILDLVFVIGLGMSTDGVELESVLSQCVSAGSSSARSCTARRSTRLSLKKRSDFQQGTRPNRRVSSRRAVGPVRRVFAKETGGTSVSSGYRTKNLLYDFRRAGVVTKRFVYRTNRPVPGSVTGNGTKPVPAGGPGTLKTSVTGNLNPVNRSRYLNRVPVNLR